jgi:serine/threonine-protein kinase
VLKVGDVVGGRYELRSELGRGGAGVVFEAVHQLTERTIAVKVISSDLPSTQVAEQSTRLIREARALASVRHPGIVDVLDGGMLEDGTPFVVLEKLHGRTLEGLLAARGKLSREDAVAIVLQLCDALDSMHRVGVVHRDLKPSNIFVVRDPDGVERIKLLDFGVAALSGTEHRNVTAVGAVVGTPAYMSREQLLALDVDQRADIYALGVTLFECVSGRLPYEGNYQSVLLQVCSPDAKAPRLSDIMPEVGAELSAAVERATAIDRDDRFSTAVEFGSALHAALPAGRSRTFFLGPPPLPKFGPAPPPQEPVNEQRRNAPRAPCAAPAQIQVDAATIDGHLEDISEGGALFICRSPCEAGGVATVRFALPIEGKVATCQAHVRWVRAARPSEPGGPRAIGLEFIDAAEPIRAAIARYVLLMGSATR